MFHLHNLNEIVSVLCSDDKYYFPIVVVGNKMDLLEPGPTDRASEESSAAAGSISEDTDFDKCRADETVRKAGEDISWKNSPPVTSALTSSPSPPPARKLSANSSPQVPTSAPLQASTARADVKKWCLEVSVCLHVGRNHKVSYCEEG